MRWVSPRVIRGNRGDLLSRWGILSALERLDVSDVAVFCAHRRHLPRGRFTAFPYGPLYNLIPPPDGWRALSRSDVVLWTGGLDLQDDSSLAKLVHTLIVFSTYRALGLRILVVMQGAGPLTTPLGRWLARRILRLVTAFITRDPGTHRLLVSLGTRARLVEGYDGVFLDGVDAGDVGEEEGRAIERLVADPPRRPVVGVNVRLWFHFASSSIPYQFAKRRYRARAAAKMARVLDALVAVVQALRAEHDARIVLLSMYEPGVEAWEDDLPFLREVKTRFATDDDVRLLEAPLSIPAFYRLVSGLDLVIGMRLHSALTAVRAGVPAIHLCYTDKGRDIFRSLGLGDYVIDLSDLMAKPRLVADKAAGALVDRALRARIAGVADEAIARNRAALAGCVASLREGR